MYGYENNKDFFDNGFKIRLNYSIKQKMISNRKLALYCGVNERTITKWRNQDLRYPANLKHINKLCTILNVNASWLMKGFIKY